MKKLFIIFVLLISVSCLFAQTIDELTSHAKNAFNKKDYKESIQIYEKALSLIKLEEISDSNYLELLNDYSKVLAHSGNFSKAFEAYERIIEFTKNKNLKDENIDAKIALVNLLMMKKRLDTSEVIIRDILSIDSLRYFTMSNCYNNLGRIYTHREDYDSAISFYKKSIEIDINNKDSSSMPFSCLDLASTYSFIDNQNLAIDYLILGEKYLRPKKDNFKRAMFLNRFARVYYAIGNMVKSEKYALKQLALAKEMNLRKSSMTALILLGDISLYNQNPDKAMAYYQKADSLNDLYYSKHYKAIINIGLLNAKMDKGIEPDKNDLLEFSKTKSSISENTGMFSSLQLTELKLSAKTLSKKEFNNNFNYLYSKFDSIQKPSLLRSLMLIKYKYSKRNKYYKDALSALEEYNNLSKEMRKANNAFSLEELETKYQGEKKALKIKLLDEQNTIGKNKISYLKTILVISGIALFLLLVLLFILFILNTKIRNQKKIISKALKDKEILMREIHHRVKNNLQLISSLLTLQGRSIDDKMAIQAINEGKTRVRSMALIHQNLYNKENLTEIGIKDYLEKLSEELFLTYNIDGDRIKLELNVEDIDVDVDILVPLGLIINELITNSLKYAFPDHASGLIKINIFVKNNDLIFQIEDNGIGYDPTKIRENSFGSTLISALTSQLEGKMYIDAQSGTKIKIVFADYITQD